MELRVLKYFLEAARQGNITKAAEALSVTQPTMSRQLKDLEWELGEKLFERTNYAIRLTPAGQLLLERAQEIVELSDKT
ncbi:MAG: LysR family transcriptional regulator, partial [Spirochaetia bacterium]|nr:LysR family transcriptional regulator [Spirochaetia bacterium]